jgi:hypothetical protein
MIKFDTITLIYCYSKNSITIIPLIFDISRIELVDLELI